MASAVVHLSLRRCGPSVPGLLSATVRCTAAPAVRRGPSASRWSSSGLAPAWAPVAHVEHRLRSTPLRPPPVKPPVRDLILDGQFLPSPLDREGRPRPREPPFFHVLSRGSLGVGDNIDIWCKAHGVLSLDRHWLRDSCECALCVNPHSGQKNFGTTEVPLTQIVESAERCKETGALKVVWHADFLSGGQENHTSLYPHIWEARADGRITEPNAKNVTPALRDVLWDRTAGGVDGMFFAYRDWMDDDATLTAALRRLKTHGLIFLQGVPKSEESVVAAAGRIGNLQETLYGRTWDVRSKPEAENIAYTSSFLGLHQDMLYLHQPPRLQLLHCLENSCEGGESLFSDAHRAAAMLRVSRPGAARILGGRKIKYQYKKHGHWYERYRPVIESEAPTTRVYWSPPFQGPRPYRDEGLAPVDAHWTDWVKAAIEFRDLLEQEQWLFEYKMREGECVIFDNLRVLHGRRAFNTATGHRWLKGTYVSQDVYDSKLMALGLGSATHTEPVSHVGRQAMRLHRQQIRRERAEQKKAERKEAERKEAERKEAERKEAEREEAERKEAEREETEGNGPEGATREASDEGTEVSR